jgi:REP element-mobilizing transposase RayT
MARKPRIEYYGAFYHVITRGNQKQAIFKEDADRQKYLEVLACYKKRYGYHLYAYVLMKNHVHLLVEARSIVKSDPVTPLLPQVSQQPPQQADD